MTTKNKLLLIAGPNVIESEEHCLRMAREISNVINSNLLPYLDFYFKVSFDKANRTSLVSYRGPGLEKGLGILSRIKKETGLRIITDIHETWQIEPVAKVVDMIQIPAFLCRQTDLYTEAAKYDIPIHIKKGQFCDADAMLKAAEKLRKCCFRNRIYLCERGTMFGYNDLIVDTRNLWKMSKPNTVGASTASDVPVDLDTRVTMDITHCLQQPYQKSADGIICSGGQREFIPLMGQIALAGNVDGIFMEVHDNPDQALCDAPTQFPLEQFGDFVKYLISFRNNIPNFTKMISRPTRIAACIPVRNAATRLPNKPLLRINNKTIIQSVYEQVKKSALINDIWVLTPDKSIREEAETFGAKVIQREVDCINGTERILKNLDALPNECDIIVNIQGDQPFIRPEHIDRCIRNFLDRRTLDPKLVCSTLHYRLETDIESPSIVKLVMDSDHNIMYCSRNAIPVDKNGKLVKDISYYGHVGLFVYDRNYLESHYQNPSTPYQLCQDIEWLKILEQGYHINSVLVGEQERSLDTPDDYEFLVSKY